jgi:hypothetical protein
LLQFYFETTPQPRRKPFASQSKSSLKVKKRPFIGFTQIYTGESVSFFLRSKVYLFLLASILMLVVGSWRYAMAAEAQDPDTAGPFEVASSEYRLPPAKDPFVDADVVTEIWARVYHPKYMYIKPYPVIVLLHGNHGTCGRAVRNIPGRFDDNVQYSTSGTCPPGYKVVPNHEGFAYAAEKLASWGYAVVSINANRGVNGTEGKPDDLYLNMRRGKLVLRHLMLLEQWNRIGGAPASLGFDVRRTLDFNHIGLMGHSRGGEGVLAAYNLFNENGSKWPARFGQRPNFRGIFAIAPVTNQTYRRLYADNIPWAALLPLCDGDVYTMDALQVYNRTIRSRLETEPAMKAVIGVWGANHNFYNTQWQQTDSSHCVGNGNKSLFSLQSTGSQAQRKTAVYALLAFFKAHLGHEADRSYANLFNPSYSIPKKLADITSVERIFSESASPGQIRIVDDFSKPTGFSWRQVANSRRHVSSEHRTIVDHQSSLQVNAIAWSHKPGISPASHFFQSNGWAQSKGRTLDKLQNLEFRISLACQEASPPNYISTPVTANSSEAAAICNRPFPVNAHGNIDFSVALVKDNGGLSRAVPVSRYTRLHDPVGGKSAFFSIYPPIEDFTVLAIHPLLQTVRIPLADFGIAKDIPVRGVRFIFDKSSQGSIYLANVRFSKPPPAEAPPLTSRRSVTPRQTLAPQTSIDVAPTELARIRKSAAQTGGLVSGISKARSGVDITLAAHQPIPVRDSLLMLRIGNRQFMLSRFAANGNTSQVIFSLTKEEYDALPEGADVELVNGLQHLGFGKLNKS